MKIRIEEISLNTDDILYISDIQYDSQNNEMFSNGMFEIFLKYGHKCISFKYYARDISDPNNYGLNWKNDKLKEKILGLRKELEDAWREKEIYAFKIINF